MTRTAARRMFAEGRADADSQSGLRRSRPRASRPAPTEGMDATDGRARRSPERAATRRALSPFQRGRPRRSLNEVFSDAFTDRYRRDGLVGGAGAAAQPGDLALCDRRRRRRRDAVGGDPRGAIAAPSGHRAPFRHRRLDGAARRARRLPGSGVWEGGRAGRHRRAPERGVSRHRFGNDAADDGEHRLLRRARIRARTADGDAQRSTPGVRQMRAPRLLSTLSLIGLAQRCGCARVRRARARNGPRLRLHARDRVDARDGLGDTLLFHEGDTLAGFALCHSAPLVEGRSRDELRVLKLMARDDAAMDAMIPLLADLAGRTGALDRARVAIRLRMASMRRRVLAVAGGAKRAGQVDGPADGAGGIRGAGAEIRGGAVQIWEI